LKKYFAWRSKQDFNSKMVGLIYNKTITLQGPATSLNFVKHATTECYER